jgi:hypothetical protein
MSRKSEVLETELFWNGLDQYPFVLKSTGLSTKKLITIKEKMEYPVYLKSTGLGTKKLKTIGGLLCRLFLDCPSNCTIFRTKNTKHVIRSKRPFANRAHN